MKSLLRLLTVLALIIVLPGSHARIVTAAKASSCLDVALVLSVDSSASVSRDEFHLQQTGIAEAFRDPAVLEAISAAGRVAVAVVFWGSDGLPKPQSPWMIIEDAAAAEGFARELETMKRDVTGDTGLGAGLLAALQKLDSLNECSVRRVVNVSGDGEETRVYRRLRTAPSPLQVRQLAEAGNIEINALAIANEEKDLAGYYAANVITGPDAFVMEVADYEDFGYALRKKLIREIGPRIVSERSVSSIGVN